MQKSSAERLFCTVVSAPAANAGQNEKRKLRSGFYPTVRLQKMLALLKGICYNTKALRMRADLPSVAKRLAWRWG